MNANRQRLDQMTAQWNRSTDRVTNYRQLLDFLVFLDEQLLYEYLPAVGPAHPEFIARLADWISQFDAEDQPTAMLLAGEVCFYGSMDFAAIWQSAYRNPISRWLIDTLDIPLVADLEPALTAAMSTTWVCSASDSMNIAGFFHVNNIVGGSIRPDWRSLVKLSDASRIVAYMRAKKPIPLERVVILEDFVGSGSQLRDILELAEAVSEEFPVLVCPMLCCQAGAELGRAAAESTYGRLRFEPLSMLSPGSVLEMPSDERQARLFNRVTELCRMLYDVTVQDDIDEPWTPGPLGFGDIGALSIMYTNCPNNTIPLLHYYSPRSSWRPLFPRSARE